jgi:acyl-CoA reductase-like NAD-dependent aldehyde dehydrogenase
MTPEGVFIRHPDKLFIGGEWVAPLSGESIEVESPVTEEIVARVAAAGNADMDRAVAAAREAFDHGSWPTTPPAERGAMLMKLADALERRVPEIAAAWCAQIGGLQKNSVGMQMGSVMGLRGIAALGESFAWTETRKGQMVDTAIIAREPVGVVVGIAPWNAPFGIMMNKVAYSLTSGCTVIMKPSPETPLEAYIIAEAAEEAGLPPGTVNLV